MRTRGRRSVLTVGRRPAAQAPVPHEGDELAAGTDPNDSDSDDDGVPDGQGPSWNSGSDGDGLINALDPDSDDDGLFDGTEFGLDCSDGGTDPLAGNCVADGDGGATTTDPLNPDTDDGGVNDGSEDTYHDGAVDAGERNPNDGSDDIQCVVDADCGATDSGLVCDGSISACIAGCRGTGGNGCPAGEVCTSTDDTIGECITGSGGGGGGTADGGGAGAVGGTGGTEPPAGDSGGVYTEGAGLFCTVQAPGERTGSGLALLGLIAGLGVAARRRSSHPVH